MPSPSNAAPADAIPPSSSPPRGALMAIFLIILVDFLGFGLIIPLLPFYVPDYKENAIKVGLIFSIFSICQFIGAPVLGALSDRHGRRPVLIISQLGSAFGYILLAIAALGTWSDGMRLFLVYLSRVIDGFTGGNVSTAQAYIADVTDSKSRAKGMGLIGAAFGIGFSLGPAMGALLAHYVHVTAPAYAAAALAALAAYQTWAKLPESAVHRPTEAQAWLRPSTFIPILKKPIVLQFLLIAAISMAAFVMMEAVIGIYLAQTYGWGAGLPEDEARKIAGAKSGWFFAYVGLIIVIVQGGMIRPLMKRMSEWPLAIMGPILVGIGMAMYAWTAWVPEDKRPGWFSYGMLVLLAAGAVNAVGRSLQQPTISSLLSKYSDPKEQGAVFGLYHGLMSLARVAGPIIAGLAYPYWKNTGPFWTGGVIAIIAGVWTAAVRIQAAQHPAPGEQPAPAEAEAQAARSEVE